MNRIRVLQILWRFDRGGGVARVPRLLFQGLDRERFEMHLCALRPFDEADRLDLVRPGVLFHSLDFRGDRTAWRRARSARRLMSIAGLVDPDVLHVHASTAWYSLPWVLKERPRAGRILEVHDSPASGRMSGPNLRAARHLVRRHRFVPLAHSREVQEGWAGYLGCDVDHVRVIPLAVDVAHLGEPLDTTAARARLGLPRDSPVVVYVARQSTSKRLRLFLEVAALVRKRVPDVQFVLAGAGDPDPVRRMATELDAGGYVHALGFVESLADVYAASDLFLSTSEYEGFGLAVAESLATGTPVVAAEVGGLADVVDDGETGVLVGGTPEELATATADLLNDRVRLDRMSEAARSTARDRFDLRRMVDAFEGLYEAVRPPGATPSTQPVYEPLKHRPPNGAHSPRVSVILPTCARPDVLPRAIDSVLGQSFSDFELLVVDDEPSETTKKVVLSYDDDRMRYLAHDHNRGLSAARNTGIHAARGRFLAFVDDDDEYAPEKLERQLQAIESSGAHVVTCYEEWVSGENPARLRAVHLKGDVRRRLARTDIVHVQSLLLARECLESVGLCDEGLRNYEDYELSLRLADRFRFHTVREPLYRFHRTSGSLSQDVDGRAGALRRIIEVREARGASRRQLSRWWYRAAALEAQRGSRAEWRAALARSLRLNPGNLRSYAALVLGTVAGPAVQPRLGRVKNRVVRRARNARGGS